MFIERRKNKRIPFSAEVTISQSDGSTSIATSENISAGGMAIRSNKSFYNGESICVSFSIPSIENGNAPQKITLNAFVLHTIKLTQLDNTFMLGIEFHKPDRSSKNILKNIIKNN